MNAQHKEQGQVLVIFAVALVAMLGFVALAVDGSMIYSDHRYSQNAADSAALAGASAASQMMANNSGYWWSSWDCNNIQPVKDIAIFKAVERAAANKYTITEQNLDTANNGVQVQCVDLPYDKYMLVRVKVTTTVNTGFAQLFYSGPVKNTVEGVARIKPRTPMAFGNAIVALDSNCAYDGVDFHGTTNVNAFGGGVFSNSCMSKSGTSGGIYVPDSGVNYHTTFSGHTEPFSPNTAKPQATDASVTLPTLPTPNCAALPDYRGTHPGDNITYGRYDAMVGDKFLSPGLYCIYGDIRLEGEHNQFYGDNVTIYFVTGGFRLTGNADINISAPTSATPANYALQDILILMAPTNTDELILQGNSESHFTGLILAPNQSVDIGGCPNSDSYNSQIVGRNVKFHGTPDVNVTFMNSEKFMTPVMIDMHK